MKQVKHGTASEASVKRYASPRATVVLVKTQGILCLSDPSLTGWENGSNSDDIDMGD